MLLKSKTLQRASTEIVDVAGIDRRIFALPREVSVKKKRKSREVSRSHSTYGNERRRLTPIPPTVSQNRKG
jgi:hypothetical protein